MGDYPEHSPGAEHGHHDAVVLGGMEQMGQGGIGRELDPLGVDEREARAIDVDLGVDDLRRVGDADLDGVKRLVVAAGAMGRMKPDDPS
mgnify:CR=1 FL=1